MALSPSFALSLSPTVLSGRLQFGAVLRRKACAVGASSPTCLGSLSRDHRSECRVTPELRGQSDSFIAHDWIVQRTNSSCVRLWHSAVMGKMGSGKDSLNLSKSGGE
jgi:hypothetical protein